VGGLLRRIGHEGTPVELTMRRFVGIAVGGFALLALAFPPRPVGNGYNGTRADTTRLRRVRVARSATYDTLASVRFALWTLDQRDSARRLVSSIPAGHRDQLMADPTLPESFRRLMQANYAATRVRRGEGMPLPVVVLLDSDATGGVSSALWLEDTTSGTAGCVTVRRLFANHVERMSQSRLITKAASRLGGSFPQPRHFGLCGFEAKFGPPSPAIRTWLQDRGWRPVEKGYDPNDRPMSNGIYSYAALPFMSWWTDDYQWLLAARACEAGRLDQCHEVAVPKDAWRALGGRAVPGSTEYRSTMDPHGSPDFMNALATTMGPERFLELWQGNETPLVAYQRLMGVPVDTLARRLLLGRDALKNLEVGSPVVPSVAEAVFLLVLCGVSVGLVTLSWRLGQT
jgi:hypothetical protein